MRDPKTLTTEQLGEFGFDISPDIPNLAKITQHLPESLVSPPMQEVQQLVARH